MTILQARLISEAIADEQMFAARIAGCEVKEDDEELAFESFSDGFSAMRDYLK